MIYYRNHPFYQEVLHGDPKFLPEYSGEQTQFFEGREANLWGDWSNHCRWCNRLHSNSLPETLLLEESASTDLSDDSDEEACTSWPPKTVPCVDGRNKHFHEDDAAFTDEFFYYSSEASSAEVSYSEIENSENLGFPLWRSMKFCTNQSIDCIELMNDIREENGLIMLINTREVHKQ